METVLENIATGIVSFDREGFVTRINQSAVRLSISTPLPAGTIGTSSGGRSPSPPLEPWEAEGRRSRGGDDSRRRPGASSRSTSPPSRARTPSPPAS
jgi:hypothetical protein